jgi:protein-tyrosine phosphatase
MLAPYKSDPLFLQSPAASLAHASEIMPGLWIGDAAASQDAAFFKRHGIGAVINATKDVPIAFQVESMRIAVDDNLNGDEIKRMCQLLPHAASFLYKNHVLENKAVLVHCAAGVQRSATIVAYYLHTYFGYSMQDAIALILAKRPVAFFGGKAFNFRACLGF